MSDSEDLQVRRGMVGVALLASLIFTIGTPVFALTYSQPDMGLIVIAAMVPLGWVIALGLGILALVISTGKVSRVSSVVILSAVAIQPLLLGIDVVIGTLTSWVR